MNDLTKIQKVVIDLASLERFTEELEPVLEVLLERDYQIVLMTSDLEKWSDWKGRCGLMIGSEKERLSYLKQDTIWVTDADVLQKECDQRQVFCVRFSKSSVQNFAIDCESFKELVALLDPSYLTTIQIAQDLIAQKEIMPQHAMIVCVEGAEQCGHIYLVEKLVEQLEQSGQFVQGLDLTGLSEQLWQNTEQGKWVLQTILVPFANSERILIEKPPLWAIEQEISIFPLFLSPEMILVVWGSFLMTSHVKSQNILLKLSDKAATARVFGIDDRENFDPDFIEKYRKTEGRHYQQYLKTIDEVIHWRVNFDNFHAFRMQTKFN